MRFSKLLPILCAIISTGFFICWLEIDLSAGLTHPLHDAVFLCPEAEPADVILSADATNAHGALATINSLIDASAASECSLGRLRIFFFAPPHDVPLYRALFAATNSTYFHSLFLYQLPPLDIPDSFKVSTRFAQAERDLTASPNFVRLFIDQVTDVASVRLREAGQPPISRVLWLDTDVIVLQDVVPVFDTVLRGSRTSGPVIATSFNNDPHGYRVMFEHHSRLVAMVPAVDDCLNKTTLVRQKDLFCPHFNAGVMFMHVDRWRASDVSTLSSLLLQANANFGAAGAKLWDHVSNPPLVLLAVMFGIEATPRTPQMHFRLDSMAPKEVDKMPRAVQRSLPLMLHFNGDTKPWMPAMACEHWKILSYFEVNFIGYGCPFAQTNGTAAIDECATLRPLGTRKDLHKSRFTAWCRAYKREIGEEVKEGKHEKKLRKQLRRREAKEAMRQALAEQEEQADGVRDGEERSGSKAEQLQANATVR